MAAKLIAEEGFLKGLVLPLDEGHQWVIGRDPDQCQLVVEDPAASRRQLICRSTPQGIVIENLSDTNPTEVNDEKIHGPQALRHGDAVKIGSGIFRFYIDTTAHVDMPTPTGVSQTMTNESVSVEQEKETEEEDKRDSIFEEGLDEREALAKIDFDLMEVGRWFLKVISGPNTGAEFGMQPSTSYIIGTDPSICDIVFHDASVSRQHARLTIGKEDSVTIEDLKSRNGTFVNDEQISASKELQSNTIVTMGTTAFVVLDREGKRDTIISPLLPSIVKALQREETKKTEEEKEPVPEPVQPIFEAPKPVEKTASHYGALILISMITGILIIVGIGTMTLFKTQEVVAPHVDVKAKLDAALTSFPSVKYSFNQTTGRLLLVGHVTTPIDRIQLMYNLQGLNFIKSIDSNIIIDEYAWQEINQLLAQNPNWRSITVHSTSPGHFVVSGYLKSRAQADQLSDFLGQNFPYPDLLERQVVVEEDVLTKINVALQEQGIREVAVQMSNGEVSLSGGVNAAKMKDLEKVIAEIKAIPGVRAVNNFVMQLAPEQSVINITSKYQITGYSNQGNVNQSVIINGRILSRGDVLDGMTITSIKPSAVFLEKDGINYRIDYNK